jgi:hypothetical protein
MSKNLVISTIMVVALAGSPSIFAQTAPTGQQRIGEAIQVSGQPAQGVLLIENGGIVGSTCPSPQQYVTANQSESGWACFEQTSGMWLLHAQPPSQNAPVYQQAPLPVYVPPAVVSTYGYYPYVPYDYYPYGYYPYAVRAGFGFGFAYRSPVFFNRPVIRPIAPFGGGRPVGGGFGRSTTRVGFARGGGRR